MNLHISFPLQPSIALMLSLACALVACATSGSSAQSTAACEARVTRLERLFEHATNGAVSLPKQPGIRVPRVTIAGAVARDIAVSTVVVVVDSTRLWLDERELTEQQLSEDIAVLARNWSILYPREAFPGRVAVWADVRTPIARLVALAAGPLRGLHLDVLAVGPEPPHVAETPPCPTSLGALCVRPQPQRDSNEAARLLSRALTSAVGDCRPLIEGFPALANLTASDRNAEMRRFVPEALRSCGCAGMNAAEVEYLSLLLTGVFDMPMYTYELVLDDAPAGLVGEWVRAQSETTAP